MSKVKRFLIITFLALFAFSNGCGGGGGNGGDPGTLRIFIDSVQFKDLNSLYLNISRVEVVITSDLSEKGEVVVISDEPDTANLIGFAGITPKLFAIYPIYQTGYITQIRFIVESTTAEIGFETYEVTIPSGPQTGEKVIAADEIIQIIDGGVTDVTVRLDPEHSVLNNLGKGYILKPVIKAEAGATSSLPIDKYVPHQITVLFFDTASKEEIEQLINQLNATVISKNPYFPFYVLGLPETMDVIEAQNFLNESPIVNVSLPNYIMFTAAIPNDPYFNYLWGMNNTGQTGGKPDADIDAPEAWDITRGSNNIVIAVIDTGVDYNHPDLSQNIWVNQAEANGWPFIDDDNNGYIDDVYGWNFAYNNNDPMDDHGHGTHVAGTIGAIGNNGKSVAGVNWAVKIMPIKVLDYGGYGTLSNYFNALAYAAHNGAHITSASLRWIVSGSLQYYHSLYDAAGTDICSISLLQETKG